MSWAVMMTIVEAEAGPEVRDRIEARIRRDLPGETVTLPGRRRAPKAAWSPPLPPKAPPPRLIR